MPSREEVVVLQQRLQQELELAEKKHHQALMNEFKLLFAGISCIAAACILELTRIEFYEESFIRAGAILIILALYADLGRAEPEKEVKHFQSQLSTLNALLENDSTAAS